MHDDWEKYSIPMYLVHCRIIRNFDVTNFCEYLKYSNSSHLYMNILSQLFFSLIEINVANHSYFQINCGQRILH